MDKAAPKAASETTALPDQPPRKDAVVLEWTVHLLKRRPQAAVAAGLSLAAVLITGTLLFHNAILALIPTLTLFGSLAEYYLPTKYTLTATGARSKCGWMVLEMPWTDVRHAYLAPDGVKLSPLRAKNSRFERMRGVMLRFNDNSDQVIETVRSLRAEAAEQ
ncbi:MAG: hypothetical protein ABIY70_13040 [Capsulimonas sp.]|uniref:hypothetical protein n=1 Tax=Capsulimonas sp. TaxID=2494211 RepID=UPI0032630FAD